MTVEELIEKLKQFDPKMPVRVGIACSCHGTGEASDVSVVEEFGIVTKIPEHVYIDTGGDE